MNASIVQSNPTLLKKVENNNTIIAQANVTASSQN